LPVDPTGVTAGIDAPKPEEPEEPALSPGISQTFPSDDNKTPPPPPFTPSTPDNPVDPDASKPPLAAGGVVSGGEATATPGQSVQPGQPGGAAGAAPAAPAVSPGAAGPMPKVMVGDGGTDVGAPLASAAPIVTAGAGATAASSGTGGRFGGLANRKVIVPVVSAVVVLGAAAAFYFGYWMSPSVIYSQALSNTGKGYDKLIDYADKQSKVQPKGYTGSGSYKIVSEGTTIDGKINFKSNNKNADLAVDLGASGMRVSADFRTIKNSTATPDVYVKVSGIEGLGTLMGAPELDGEFAKLNDNWIVMDHTLIDQLSSEATQSDQVPLPAREQVLDEARAFGAVNKQYLLTANKDKGVLKVVKKYGKETIDGHKTYHYLVALQKNNVKKYILAQRDALKDSTLNDWLKKNKLDTSVYKSFDDAADSTKDIKSSDTFDLWADTGQRVIYKIRVKDDKNAANNYVDIGLNYKGGSNYPFFLSGKSQDNDTSPLTTYSLSAAINTDTGETGLKFSAKEDGTDATEVDANFSYKPSQSAPKIDKPANAIPLNQVLSDLGLGSVLSTGSANLSGGSAGIQLRDDLAGSKSAGTSLKTLDSSWLRQLLKQ
jgi:hypothetical protein